MSIVCNQGLHKAPIAALLVVAAASLSAHAQATEPALGRWWGDIGAGYGNMHASSGSVATGGGGLWVDAQIGGRVSSRWLMGLDIGGIGMHASNSNYDQDNYYSSVWGETLSNVFLVFQYEPKSDHGWFIGGGAGETLYSNKTLENFTGNSHTGNGPAAVARLGYDWPRANRVHFEALLSCEVGRTALNAPLSGNFQYSVIAASFHVAYH